MSISVDNSVILLYNPDTMKEYKIFEFAGIDFPFWVDKGKHTSSYSAHTHNFIELEIVVSGSADHIVEGKEYQISKGDVIVILPGFVHEIRNVQELEIYNFKFDLDKLTLLDMDIEKLSGFQSLFLFQPYNKYYHEYTGRMLLSDDKLQCAITLCDLINAEWNEREGGYKWVIKSYFLALITYLSRNFSAHVTSSSPKVQEIVTTVTFIHDNLNTKISLASLSAMACLSERQYSRIFKEIYGMAPLEYIINCRLLLACKLMKNTNRSLQDISLSSGLGDKVSFSRLFKKRYQITPGEYRRRLEQ